MHRIHPKRTGLSGFKMVSRMVNQLLKKTASRIYERFIRLQGAPRKIALGFALGILVGMTPFFGVHIVLSTVLAAVLGWSKIAAVVGVNITNVGTAPLIYPVNYWVGVKLVGASRQVSWPQSIEYHQLLQLVGQAPLIVIDLCIGGLILGIPIAVIGYFTAFRMVHAYRKRASISSWLVRRRH